MTTKPRTYEVVIYDDGTSAINEFTRDDNGHLTYCGRRWVEAQETAQLVQALKGAVAVTEGPSGN